MEKTFVDIFGRTAKIYMLPEEHTWIKLNEILTWKSEEVSLYQKEAYSFPTVGAREWVTKTHSWMSLQQSKKSADRQGQSCHVIFYECIYHLLSYSPWEEAPEIS